MRDVTRGGLGTVLNEFAEASKCRIEIEEDSIPVNQEVKGFSDILGLDPLYMANEGKMIIAVGNEDADRALHFIKETTAGKNASIIAQITDGNGVVMKTHLGGSRVVDMLFGEGLPRIC